MDWGNTIVGYGAGCKEICYNITTIIYRRQELWIASEEI